MLNFFFLICIFFQIRQHLCDEKKCILFNEENKNECQSCDISFFSFQESPFFEKPFPLEACIEKNKTKLTLIIYVSNTTCDIGSGCDGSQEHPFENLLMAWRYLENICKTHLFSDVTIYLLGNGFMPMRERKSDVEKTFYFFRKTWINLSISPLFCKIKRIYGCLEDDTEKIHIFLGSNNFFLFISGKLTLLNLILNGIDMNLEISFIENNYEKFLHRRTPFCSFNDSKEAFKEPFGNPSLKIILL